MAKVNGKKLGIGVVMGVTCVLIAGGLFGLVKSATSGTNTDKPAATTIEGNVSSGAAVGAAIPADDNNKPVDCSFTDWVGKTAETAEAAAKETGRPYRILPPGSAMTMDYRHDRINVELNGKGIVTKVTCG